MPIILCFNVVLVYNANVANKDFQKLLFQIYSKESIRKEFLESPSSLVNKFDLKTNEREAILSLPQHNVERFSSGLAHKKKKMLNKFSIKFSANPKFKFYWHYCSSNYLITRER